MQGLVLGAGHLAGDEGFAVEAAAAGEVDDGRAVDELIEEHREEHGGRHAAHFGGQGLGGFGEVAGADFGGVDAGDHRVRCGRRGRG